MRRVLIVAVLALVLPLSALAAAQRAASSFTPAKLAGTWKGTWTNQTFHTHGTLLLKVSGTRTMVLKAKITGNTFGCTPPGLQTFKVPKGSGATGWTAKGFKVHAVSNGFGDLTASYTYATRKIKAMGSHVKCSPGLTFSVAGKWTAKALNATATIHLNGGQTAKTVVKLTRH